MWKTTRSYLRHALDQLLGRQHPHRWRPLLAVYYLTYRCQFHCPYCSDGAGRPYHALNKETLEPARVLELLGQIRCHCDHLVITGGEPLTYAGLEQVMAGLPALKFDSVILTTNGHDLAPHLEQVVPAVTHLVFSLDTLDRARADARYGVGPGALDRILENIELARGGSRRRSPYEIIISSVASPDNLVDLREVYAYADARGYRFALCPQLQGVHPHPALRDNPDYQSLFAYLIEEKRRGKAINGSPLYLRAMQRLEKFDCRPSTLLAVNPLGNVFYPCLELGQVAGNLLEMPDLDLLLEQGRQRFGPEPSCGNQCHSACALGFSLLLTHPLSLVEEAYLALKGKMHTRR